MMEWLRLGWGTGAQWLAFMLLVAGYVVFELVVFAWAGGHNSKVVFVARGAGARRSSVMLELCFVAVLAGGAALAGLVKAWFRWVRYGAGMALEVLGCGLRLWCVVALGRGFTADLSVGPGARLVTGGPYRWVRHPAYVGSLLANTGLGLCFGTLWAALWAFALSLVVYLYRVWREEGILVQAFGEAYINYRKRTGMLLPRRQPGAGKRNG